MTQILKRSTFFILTLCTIKLMGQDILPPVMEWHGKSEQLIAKPNNPWITPCEVSGFQVTPTYDETISWFQKLTAASPLFSMVAIGTSPEGRTIFMVIASADTDKSPRALKDSEKPLLLAQAGIHAGEIDGKDAGMMLLRDIAFGKKAALLDQVNFLFVPILNVDGHENSSPYNRPNQRGPINMGWRTNAQNLNLNRDYSKLDTKELQSIVTVMNEYDPLLYMDLHVTDGADYQYDITYTGTGLANNSPAISNWIENTFKPHSDTQLESFDHIPGPLVFALNGRDFSKGNLSFGWGARFSDGYGMLRHTCSILVENHSLKPYKQRVLGTYVLLESTLKLLAAEGKSLQKATTKDQARRDPQLATAYKVPQLGDGVSFESLGGELDSSENANPPDSVLFLGITSKIRQSEITNSEYVEWLGQPITMKIPQYEYTQPTEWVSRPKGYWVPSYCTEVINRLKVHGMAMEEITEPRQVEVEMYRMENAQFGDMPYEGHFRVSATSKPEVRQETYPAGSVYISTDQPLGDLAVILLEPRSEDSFFSWGFFSTIFQRTEYIEAYVIEPLARKMLAESPELKAEFEQKLKEKDFADDPGAIRAWFYRQSQYYDQRYLLYPVGREK
ncbi:M14 family metallopeptidase [Marinoscillum sp.]|uniref:M14 family metallopeptidase n=1 Tax=Marinoscillum sp. TaxID=2024838 RepID=UPI003BA956BF